MSSPSTSSQFTNNTSTACGAGPDARLIAGGIDLRPGPVDDCPTGPVGVVTL